VTESGVGIDATAKVIVGCSVVIKARIARTASSAMHVGVPVSGWFRPHQDRGANGSTTCHRTMQNP
jgi:hypothetical protein